MARRNRTKAKKHTGVRRARAQAKKPTNQITRTNSETSPERFVEIWQTSETSNEAAARAGVTVGAVHSRVRDYRNFGVPLKKMRNHGGGPAVDWSALAGFAGKFK